MAKGRLQLETDRTKTELAFINIQLRNQIRELQAALAKVEIQNAALWIQIQKDKDKNKNKNKSIE